MYWRDIFCEAYKRTRKGLADWRRIVASIAIPIVAGLIATAIQIHKGVSMGANIAVSVGSAIVAYLLFVLVEFVFHVFRLPGEMHAENLRKLRILETDHAELRQRLEAPPPPPPPDPITVTVQRGQWGVPRIQTAQGIVEASFPIKIRNGGTPTILDDWALRSRSRPDLTSKLIEFNLGSPNAPSVTDVRTVPLPQGAAVAGSVVFQITGISLPEAGDLSLEWFLEFSDATRNLHKVDIPKEHYPPSR
jgi:hypothetical protein